MLEYNLLLFTLLTGPILQRVSHDLRLLHALFFTIFLFLFISLRVNTGNDWDGYYNYLLLTRDNIPYLIDPVFKVYFHIISNFDWDVFFVSFPSFISFVLFIIASRKFNHSYFDICFVFLCSGMIFFVNNQTRQSIAMWLFFIFLGSRKGRFIRKMSLALAAFGTHLSTILLLPLSRQISIHRYLFMFIVSCFLPMHFLGVFIGLDTWLMPQFGFILDRYQSKQWLFDQNTSRGLAILLWYIMFIGFGMFTQKEMNGPVFIMAGLGIILKTLFYDSILISRFVNYLLYANVFLLLYMLGNLKLSTLKIAVYFLLVLNFQYLLLLEGAEHGGLPYYNILLDDVDPNSGRNT